MKPRYAALSALSALTAVTLGAALPASAAPSTTVPRDLTNVRTACLGDIDLRLATLSSLGATLAKAGAVTAAHRDAQQASLTAATGGLTTLRQRVEGDADLPALKADCQAVVQDYRVFALRSPQTHLIIVGDTQAAAAATVAGTVPALTTAIDKVAAAGRDVTAARTALADLQAKLADATSKAPALADRVIGDAPADFNADKALLTPARTTALEVRADLVGARTDLKAIAAALKAAATS